MSIDVRRRRRALQRGETRPAPGVDQSGLAGTATGRAVSFDLFAIRVDGVSSARGALGSHARIEARRVYSWP